MSALRTSTVLRDRLLSPPEAEVVSESEWARAAFMAAAVAGVASASMPRQVSSCAPAADDGDEEEEEGSDDEEPSGNSRRRSKPMQDDPFYIQVLADAERCVPPNQNAFAKENAKK